MLANVSVGTVSRYINKHPSVSKKNAIKIQKAIDKLGYIPNLMAQNLAKGVSNNLLLYILQEKPILESTWLYELPIIQTVYDYIKPTNYSLQLAMDYLEDKLEISRFFNEYVNNKRVDGIIILSTFEIGDANILRLIESKMPFVLLGNQTNIQSTNQILFNNYDAINEIMDHLYELGHRRIAFINGFANQQHMIQRAKAYFDSVQRLDLETYDEWVKNANVPITLDADGEGKLLSVNIDDEGYTHLELKLGDIDEIYIVTYTSVIVAESGVKITNTAALAGFEEKAGNSSNKIFTARQSSWGTGSGREDRGQIQIIKVDKETEETIENNPAQFELYYILNGEKRIVNGAAQTTEKGMLQYGNLPFRTYYLREMEAPEGYVLTDGEPMEIIVDRDNKSIELEIENTKIKMDVTGTKKWINGELNRPDSIYLQLYQNGAAYGDPVQLSKDNKSSDDPSQWVYTWEDLDKTDIDGKEHIYSVKEVDEEGNDFVPSNYVKEEDGLKVTNTYVIPTKGSAAATKKWADGPSEKPTIWFKLYRYIVAADGGEAEPEEVPGAEIKELADGVTKVVWTGLEETDISGKPYNFLVKEVDQDGNDFAPTNYVKAENGMDVTNYYVSPTDASAKAIKVWENGPSERPTTWFKLYRHIEAEGETAEIGEVFGAELEEVPEAEIKELPCGVTEVVWTGLTRTDKYGNEYNFSVKEVDAEGNDFVPESYAKSEDGLTVTNRYVIPEISVTGTKVWEGGPKDKPAIELQLYKDGETFGEPVTLDGTEETPWTYTWVGLEATDINGKEYIYTVDEVETPENYVKTLSEHGLTVTNTYVSPKIEITGNKVWIGAPLEKPDIELQLFRNGEAYGDPVPLKDGATSYTWTDLDLTDMDGVKYVYTIDEAVVPRAYWKTLSEDGLTVINTYDIELDNKVPGGSGSGGSEEDGDSLPKTGMVSSLRFYIPGMLLLVLGTLGMFYNRRKKALDRK